MSHIPGNDISDDDLELKPQPKRHWILRSILGFFALVFVLIIGGAAFVYYAPEDWLRTLIGANSSEEIGRSFSVDGPIKIDWDWTQPKVEINTIKLANMQGAPEPDMVSIDQLNFRIKIWDLLKGQLNLPDIQIVKPVIILEKFSEDSKNWDFPALSKANAATSAALPSKRSNFPLIGLLSIHQGTLIYRDKTLKLDTTLQIDTASGSSEQSFKLSGAGALQGQKFSIAAEGGSLDMLRNSSAAYPLDLNLEMGETKIKVHGTFTDPVQMEGVDTQVDISGANLADLFYLTNIPLPPTPVYSLSGHLTETGKVWNFQQFRGKVGESDISGDLTDDTTGKRNFIKAALVSNQLRMEDLKGFIGETDTKGSDTDKKDDDAKKNEKLLPDVPLDLTRLRSADMDIDFKATKINEPGYPLDNMDVRFVLKDGVLTLDPLGFGVAGGKLSGTLVLNGQNEVPNVNADLKLVGINLKPFFTNPKLESLSSGHFSGRMKLEGDGKSLADVLSDSNGRVSLIMSGGQISKLIIDAAGLDIAKAAPALLGSDETTDIRCAIGDFGVKDGLLKSDAFVIDTKASNIEGKAKINLKDETMDASIEGNPKNITISGQIPIVISGKLRSPSIGLDPQVLAERGGVAAALGIALTPIAAIIPFIDVDLGQDSDCAGLIQAAKDHAAQPIVVAPKDQSPATDTPPTPQPAVERAPATPQQTAMPPTQPHSQMPVPTVPADGTQTPSH